jgi:hypothetical protein
MTITSTQNRVSYDGDGELGVPGVTAFSVPFRFLAPTDLVVLVRVDATGVSTTKTLDSDYSVAGEGAATGGTVTFLIEDGEPQTGETLIIYGNPAMTQLVDYISGGTFPAESHEEALDRVTLQGTRTREIAERALPLTEVSTDGSGQYDANGNRISNLGTPTATTDAATKTYVDAEINNAGLTIPTGLIASGGITSRSLADRWGEIKNVKDYGATGDGVADDTAALNAAFSAVTALGGGEVVLPAGTYRITGQLTPGANVSIRGSGIGTTLIDGSAATYTAGFGSTGMLVYPAPSYTALPALAANVSRNDRTLTFASAPSVVAGDVIQIYNPTDSSWSGFRTYYRAGESVRVASVAGSVVTLQGTTAQAYLIADVAVYKLANPNTVRLSNFSFKGLADAAAGHTVKGIALSAGVDCMVENVRAYNSSYLQIYLDGCFNASVIGCVCEEDFSSDHSGDYGLAIGGCTNVAVVGGYFSAARHGITIGNATVFSVPNRYHKIMGAHVSTNGAGGVQAADIHGNSEWITYDGCTIDGGIDFGGDHIAIRNCLIRGDVSPGGTTIPAIYGAEFRGCHMSIQNNVVQHSDTISSRGAFVDIGGNGNVISANTVSGGTIVVSGNNFQWYAPAGVSTHAWLSIYQRGYVGTEGISAVITGNTLTTTLRHGDYGKTSGQHGMASVRWLSGDIWDRVVYNNNVTTGAGGLYINETGTNVVKSVECKNNSVAWSGYAGFFINGVSDQIHFTGNTAERCALSGAWMGGSAGGQCEDVQCSDNLLTHNHVQSTSSSLTNAGALFHDVKRLYYFDNQVGTDAQRLSVASNAGFTLGETITGSASGVTAKVTGVITSTVLNIFETASGTFDTATPDTITGADSGSTTTAVAQTHEQFYGIYTANVTEAWRRNNIDFNNKPLTLAITTDHGGVVALDNTGTPTVAGGSAFTTGGTTTITDFDDGEVGQTITVKAKHSLQITDGGDLELAGNFAMTTGDTITLTMIETGKWSEISRSDIA